MRWKDEQIVKDAGFFVKDLLEKEGTGHDWSHCYRVYSLATDIAEKERKERDVDLFTVQLAAWLHDVKDWKFTSDGNSLEGAEIARTWLLNKKVDKTVVDKVYQIVRDISYKCNIEGNLMTNIEGKIVQDADRLEAMGAIGICRAMAYGGYKKRPIHDPQIEPVEIKTVEQYKKSGRTSINHFFEKLLKLKDQMHTQRGRELAEKRDCFMRDFLKQFHHEWEQYELRGINTEGE